jgi:hypothetical protein
MLLFARVPQKVGLSIEPGIPADGHPAHCGPEDRRSRGLRRSIRGLPQSSMHCTSRRPKGASSAAGGSAGGDIRGDAAQHMLQGQGEERGNARKSVGVMGEVVDLLVFKSCALQELAESIGRLESMAMQAAMGSAKDTKAVSDSLERLEGMAMSAATGVAKIDKALKDGQAGTEGMLMQAAMNTSKSSKELNDRTLSLESMLMGQAHSIGKVASAVGKDGAVESAVGRCASSLQRFPHATHRTLPAGSSRWRCRLP